MTTCILPQPTTTKKLNTDRVAILEHWIADCNKSIDSLAVFRRKLESWQSYAVSIPDDAFMTVMDDLAYAGLFEWFDARDIDALREAVTSQEAIG